MPKRWCWRFTTGEVIHVVMEMLGDQTESIKENMLREEGVAEFDPASVNGSESLSRRQCWDE